MESDFLVFGRPELLLLATQVGIAFHEKNLQVFHLNVIETKWLEQLAHYLENQHAYLSNLF